jgi:predicted HicB family RNase H-like nuclease
MLPVTGPPPMAKDKRDDITVKIAARVFRKAKMIAAFRDVSLQDYLSEVLARPVDRDYKKMREEMAEDDTPETT